MASRRRELTQVSGLDTAASGKPSQRFALPKGVSFWAAAAILSLPFAANTAASPLYRVYQAQYRFSATTLTLLFTVYIAVLCVTLFFLGSLSDYLGRRPLLTSIGQGALGAVTDCVAARFRCGVCLLSGR